ncbi:MAG: hypothetical protein KME43_15205, partial [Myxacorys chilensis ATA2-1-KO14]|nr:hypothetical protein [Myxacorys chilensis ATA2-1-KO14]
SGTRNAKSKFKPLPERLAHGFSILAQHRNTGWAYFRLVSTPVEISWCKTWNCDRGIKNHSVCIKQ